MKGLMGMEGGAGHASVGGGMGHASVGRGMGHAGMGRGTKHAGVGGGKGSGMGPGRKGAPPARRAVWERTRNWGLPRSQTGGIAWLGPCNSP